MKSLLPSPTTIVLSALFLCTSCGGKSSPAATPASVDPGGKEVQSDPPTPPTEKPEPGQERAPLLSAGSRVHASLPDDVKRFSRALMFRSADANLVVVVAELTAPEGQADGLVRGVIKGAAPLTLREEGKRGRAREFLLTGKKAGKDAQMLLLEQGGKAATVYVLSDPARKADADAILSSVSLDADQALDALALHHLSLPELTKMALGDATHQPILLTRKDLKPPIPATSAVAFVSVNPHPHGNEITADQVGGILGANLAHLKPHFEGAKSNEIEVSKRPARELVLQGEKDGKPLAMYAYAIVDGDCVIIAAAYVQMDRADEELADVVPLLRSLKLEEFD